MKNLTLIMLIFMTSTWAQIIVTGPKHKMEDIYEVGSPEFMNYYVKTYVPKYISVINLLKENDKKCDPESNLGNYKGFSTVLVKILENQAIGDLKPTELCLENEDKRKKYLDCIFQGEAAKKLLSLVEHKNYFIHHVSIETNKNRAEDTYHSLKLLLDTKLKKK